MDAARSTIWGVLLLLAIGFGVMSMRSYLVKERTECQHRLESLVPSLTVFAKMHRGQLPTTSTEMRLLFGKHLPVSTIGGLPYQFTPTGPLRWNAGTPVPYLWDSSSHPFVGGVHVLYTDGVVRLLDAIPPVATDADNL